MVHCLICSSAFWAEHSMVQGKILAWLDTYYFPVGHFEIHTALHAAVTAMRWNIAIYRLVGPPARQWLRATVKIKRFSLVLSMTKCPFIYTHKNWLPPLPSAAILACARI